jgi:hypothetical protein
MSQQARAEFILCAYGLLVVPHAGLSTPSAKARTPVEMTHCGEVLERLRCGVLAVGEGVEAAIAVGDVLLAPLFHPRFSRGS